MPRKREQASSNLIPVKQITSWSFSRYSTYDECPAKAKYQIIDKAPFKTNDAMISGKVIHALAHHWVAGTMDRLKGELANKRDYPSVPKDYKHYFDGKFKKDVMPVELELFDEEFEQLRELHAKRKEVLVNLELQWAFTRNWTPTDWFGAQTWCRIVVDNFVFNEKEGTATVIDYKTGKNRGGYEDQLKLYAAGAFALYPHLNEVRPELWFLDEGEIHERPEGPYLRKDADKIINEWTKMVKPMLTDVRFAPKPSNSCRWCDFSKSKGGACEY